MHYNLLFSASHRKYYSNASSTYVANGTVVSLYDESLRTAEGILSQDTVKVSSSAVSIKKIKLLLFCQRLEI